MAATATATTDARARASGRALAREWAALGGLVVALGRRPLRVRAHARLALDLRRRARLLRAREGPRRARRAAPARRAGRQPLRRPLPAPPQPRLRPLGRDAGRVHRCARRQRGARLAGRRAGLPDRPAPAPHVAVAARRRARPRAADAALRRDADDRERLLRCLRARRARADPGARAADLAPVARAGGRHRPRVPRPRAGDRARACGAHRAAAAGVVGAGGRTAVAAYRRLYATIGAACCSSPSPTSCVAGRRAPCSGPTRMRPAATTARSRSPAGRCTTSPGSTSPWPSLPWQRSRCLRPLRRACRATRACSPPPRSRSPPGSCSRCRRSRRCRTSTASRSGTSSMSRRSCSCRSSSG